MINDLGADHRRTSRTLFDSRTVGWGSLGLEMLSVEAEVDLVELPGIGAQLIDLQTQGTRLVESRHRSRWVKGLMEPGSLATTAPGETSRLRWTSPTGDSHVTQIRLLIPASTMRRAAGEIYGRDESAVDGLAFEDDLLRSVVTRLYQAASAGVNDLYAATAAEFIAVHLLTRHGTAPEVPKFARADARVGRVLNLLHSRLDTAVTLAELADEAGLSRFHLLRLFKAETGQTPAQFHLRLRIERAQRLLRTTRLTVAEIALQCGFLDQSHFAKTFRRQVGASPSAYRRDLADQRY